jgi:hypothetical protein
MGGQFWSSREVSVCRRVGVLGGGIYEVLKREEEVGKNQF